MKKYFTAFCLIGILFFGGSAFAADPIVDKINNLVQIVNGSGDSNSKEQKIEAEVLNLMNYNVFFIKVLKDNGGKFWNSLSSSEREAVKKKYNSQYVKNYFNMITDCKPLSVVLDDGRAVGSSGKIKKFEGYYTCSANLSEKKTLGVVSADNKVIDITINGASFIKNEGEGFVSVVDKSDEEKKRFLLG
jgi:ABC-type transporter MlaC component